MTIQLIPVLAIGYNNQNIHVPDKYPYWENTAVWDTYHQENYSKAGFIDTLTPYLAGSPFYKLADVTNDNLIKLTKDHTEELRNGKYNREQVSAFFGGYVLHIDKQDVFFPQCCGDLSDIIYWEKIVDGNENAYLEGHPQPTVKIKDNTITFDFSVEDEEFQPTPPDTILQVDRNALKKAVEKTKLELENFSERLRKINEAEKLNIVYIDKLLVWGNQNQT